MTPGPGIEPGTHWWEASTLTTAPTLLPLKASGTYIGHLGEQTGIYIITFPNAPASKKGTNHEIGEHFSTNAIVALCHVLP